MQQRRHVRLLCTFCQRDVEYFLFVVAGSWIVTVMGDVGFDAAEIVNAGLVNSGFDEVRGILIGAQSQGHFCPAHPHK